MNQIDERRALMNQIKGGRRLAALVGVVSIGLLGLGAIGSAPLGRLVRAEPESAPAWVERIARVDAALGRSDMRPAIYEWREAYGAALRTRRSDGLVAVAQRAIRIGELTGESGYFLHQAKEIYVHAALRARAERSTETILGIAEALDKLGDAERAGLVRRIAEHQS
jgi:hypothetical protein